MVMLPLEITRDEKKLPVIHQGSQTDSGSGGNETSDDAVALNALIIMNKTRYRNANP